MLQAATGRDHSDLDKIMRACRLTHIPVFGNDDAACEDVVRNVSENRGRRRSASPKKTGANTIS